MTFELSREHEEFRRSVREFAEAQIAPHAAQWDRDHHFPVDVVQQMGKLGLFGLTAPEEYGGAGDDGDFTSLCVAIEELGRVDQSMGITLQAGVGLGINPLLAYGTAEQKERWLPALVAGEALAGFGLTEPGAGSDAGATAHQGRAASATSGSSTAPSSSSPTPAPTSPAWSPSPPAPARARTAGPRSARSWCPAGTPGFTAEKAYDKLGWHASDTHPLTFEDVHVPADHLLGDAGPRLRAVPGHPRRRPDRHLGAHRSAASRPASTWRSPTPASGRPSAARSGASRASPSRSPTSRSCSRPAGC